MSKEIKGDHKHLTLSDRIYIEQALDRGDNFRSIARFIGKDPTTISLEVRRFLEWHDGFYAREVKNDCAHYSTCNEENLCLECCGNCRDCHWGRCMKLCNHYEPIICDDLKSPPYVCNGCKVQETCRAAKFYYKAEKAEKRYKTILSESRAGINMTPEQLKELDDFISPLIKQGQPLSHIFSVYGDSIPCSRKTIYNYLDMGIFTVKNIDLPRRVRYKLRKKRRGEKSHEFIRYIIPKGRSMHNLADEKVRLMTCHINSVARDGLNGQTPFDLAELLLSKKVLTSLGLQKISPDCVILKPALLK